MAKSGALPYGGASLPARDIVIKSSTALTLTTHTLGIFYFGFAILQILRYIYGELEPSIDNAKAAIKKCMRSQVQRSTFRVIFLLGHRIRVHHCQNGGRRGSRLFLFVEPLNLEPLNP